MHCPSISAIDQASKIIDGAYEKLDQRMKEWKVLLQNLIKIASKFFTNATIL